MLLKAMIKVIGETGIKKIFVAKKYVYLPHLWANFKYLLRRLNLVRTYFIKQLLTPVPASEYDVAVLASCFGNRALPRNIAQS